VTDADGKQRVFKPKDFEAKYKPPAHDSLAACINGNAIAEMLESSAEDMWLAATQPEYLRAGITTWSDRLQLQAGMKEDAAEAIRKLVAEVDRLRVFESRRNP
jgi:hypothetical protein